MIDHEDALNKILANACPSHFEDDNGTPFIEEAWPENPVRVFRIETHCVVFIVKAKLASTYREIQYDIISVEVDND